MSPTANRQARRHPETALSDPSKNGRAGSFSSAAYGVETLSYNFEVDPGRPAYKGPERGYVEIPEPSGAQITEFLNSVNAVTLEAQGGPGDGVEVTEVAVKVDGKEVAAQFASFDPTKLENFSDRLAEAVTAVCSGCPDKEEMDGLPWRSKLAFFRFVSSGFLSPKSGSGDTSN